MDTLDLALEPLRALAVQAAALLPRLGLALAVVLLGWLLAKALRFASVKALRAINFHVLSDRAGVDALLQQGGSPRDTADLVGWLVQGLVLLGALVVACNTLGLAQVSDLLGRALLFLPRVLVTVLVLVFGLYFARIVGQWVLAWRSREAGDAEGLARIARYAVATFVLLIAVDSLDIGSRLLQQVFLILLTGVVLALALAFGIGGRHHAAALLERWFPRRGG